MGVDGAKIAEVIVVPYAVEYFFTRKSHSFVVKEVEKQVVFLGSQIQGLAVNVSHMRHVVDADVSADDTQGAAQATDGKTNEVILYAPKSASGSGFFKVIRN